ncbi:hypothetical protein CesoFtcFv8_023621 [Champsocephalus esox]|uniref:Uncharacterized protein n=1 Tax=Champsocephalus esox TaxID=159716 RepID=A0AAN8GIT0_9TELE|nr:hypothetical protein CesoFtcFv8_023621 [Champsocephalus esox]
MRGVTTNKEQMGLWIISWLALQKPIPPFCEQVTIHPAIIGHLYKGILRSPEEPFCLHPLAFENNHCGSIPTSSIDAGQTGGGLTFLSTSDLKTECPNFCNHPGGQEVILEPCFVAIPDVAWDIFQPRVSIVSLYFSNHFFTTVGLNPAALAAESASGSSETPETIYSQPFL